MAKYLVVANVTAESPSLRDEVAGIVRHDPEAAFVVLVPMRPIPAVAEFVAGEDERPVALGWRRALRARRRLESVGARYVSVRLGRGDAVEAIEEALRDEPFDGVLLSTLPHPISHWLRFDLVGKLARRHPGLEIRHVLASSHLYAAAVDEGATTTRVRYD